MHGEKLHRPLGRPKFEGSLPEVRYRVIRKATALKFSPLTPVCVSDSRINSNNLLSCFYTPPHPLLPYGMSRQPTLPALFYEDTELRLALLTPPLELF